MASIGDVGSAGTDLHKHLNIKFQEQLEKLIILLKSRAERMLELQKELGSGQKSSETRVKEAMEIQRNVGTQSHHFIEEEAKVSSEVALAGFENKKILFVKQVSADSIVLATKHTDEESKYSVHMYKLDPDADPKVVAFSPVFDHEITGLAANSEHVIVTTKMPELIIFRVAEPA